MTTATPDRATADVEPDVDIPVLVGIKEIARLTPRAEHTVYRWRLPRNGHPPVLPAPFAIVSRTPLWRLETFLKLAEEKGLDVDTSALRDIRKEQGR